MNAIYSQWNELFLTAIKKPPEVIINTFFCLCLWFCLVVFKPQNLKPELWSFRKFSSLDPSKMGTGKRVTFNIAGDDDNVAIDSLIGNPKITLTTSDENAGKIGNQLFSDRKSRRTKKSFRGKVEMI